MVSVPFRFVRIRCLQVLRELQSAGFLRAFLLVCLVISSVYLFGFSQLQSDTSLAGVVLLLLVFLGVHWSRTDHRFISSVAEPPWIVFFTEYLFAAGLFVITGIALGAYLTLLIIPGILLISFLPSPTRKRGQAGRLTELVPLALFEWRAGIRKSGILFPLLYILALLLTPLPYVTLVIIWLLSGVVSSFYIENEGRELLESNRCGPSTLLSVKIRNHVLFSLLVFGLPLSVHVAFCPNEWLAVCVVGFMLLLNMALFVTTKYSSWQHGSKGASNEMIFSFSVISVLIPFLLPLPLFFLIRNYFRALKNLNPVLHDFN